MKSCRKCDQELVLGLNWSSSLKKTRGYVCKPCFNLFFKERDGYKSARTTTTKKKIFEPILSRKITNFSQDSKKRGWPLEFSYEEIGNIMKQDCSYCGPTQGYVGLDRIDSSLGYLRKNVVPCCAKCNRAKNTMSTKDFVAHCKKIISFMVGA